MDIHSTSFSKAASHTKPAKVGISISYRVATRRNILRRATNRSGSKPSYGKYTRNGGKISAQTIRAHFGTWEDALEAFQCYLDRLWPSVVRTRYVTNESNPNAYYVYRGDQLIGHYLRERL